MGLSPLTAEAVYYAAGAVAWSKVGVVTRSSLAAEWAAAWNAAEAAEYKEHARLLRDMVGDPFHSVGLHPGCRSPDVLTLAGHIYHDRDFGLTPDLAAALEDAGCTDADLLAHLRSPGPHYRGYWALDIVLGRE